MFAILFSGKSTYNSHLLVEANKNYLGAKQNMNRNIYYRLTVPNTI